MCAMIFENSGLAGLKSDLLYLVTKPVLDAASRHIHELKVLLEA